MEVMEVNVPRPRVRRRPVLWAVLGVLLPLGVLAPGGPQVHVVELGLGGIALAVLGISRAAACDALRMRKGGPSTGSLPATRVLITAGILAFALFLLLAGAIQSPGVRAWDMAFVAGVHKCGGPRVTRAVRDISAAAGRNLVVYWLPLIGLLLCLCGRARSLWFLLSALLGSLSLQAVCKTLVHRARPDFTRGLQFDSYPSGHVLTATILAGAVLMILLPDCRGLLQRGGAWLGALLWPALVAASRVYLGSHYPTDAAGGVLLGVAWVCLCTALLQWQSLRSAVAPRKAKLRTTLTAD
jgi:undecaprenyl-diphosphatase